MFRAITAIFPRPLSMATRRVSVMGTRRTAATAVSKGNTKGIKALMKKYGPSALIVYIGLMAIDLPLCYLAVHSVGNENMSLYLNKCKRVFGYGVSDAEVRDEVRRKAQQADSLERSATDWWSQFKNSYLLRELILAYGLHKALIVVRIPLTAAITPYAARIFTKYGLVKGNFLKTMADDAKIRYK
ncbi:putative N-terminal acetyltransferase 2 [Nakaseomyces bracarensis]|uniref:N-terminal acetyltransferase 2 n=1 Tax=Nakaseomyces bracarensis TaxID=273131 RepID=A0ABR4NTA7_9SACH